MIKTILVVDDDALTRDSLAQGLRANHFKVEEAADGEEGLQKALQDHPDLIIADIAMPKLDGIAMVDKLRQDEWGKEAKVIVLSNDASAVSVNQSLEAGVTLYYYKPETGLEEFVNQITEWAA